MSKELQKVSIKDAKKNYKWRFLPIDKLPSGQPVFGVVQYVTKEAAKFSLVKEVVVPDFEHQEAKKGYTEEQVISAVALARDKGDWRDGEWQYDLDEILKGIGKPNNEQVSKEEMFEFIDSLRDYTREGHIILGFDERTTEELYTIFQEQKKEK